MYPPNLKSVALPVPEIRGGSYVANPNLKEGGRTGGRGWYLLKERWGVPISLPYILFLYQHSFARNFRLQFWVGVANPQFWGRGDRRGSGMIPFERALVSFYRPSIVTFPLSLRFSEILPLLFSSTPLFPYTPPLVSPKFHYVVMGICGSPFDYTNSEGPGLIVRAISFQDFQPMWSQITSVTDRRTTCDPKTAHLH